MADAITQGERNIESRMAAILSAAGRILFSLGLLGLGIEHFAFGDFITGRAPAWPEGMPGRLVWAYATGGAVVVVSVMLLFRRRERQAAFVCAGLILIWALARHIPVLLQAPFPGGDWTRAGKAWTLIGGCLVAAAAAPTIAGLRSQMVNRLLNGRKTLILAGRILLGCFFVLTGIQHFIFVEFVASLIPDWFPGDAVIWTYIAGVFLISGGIGLFIPRTAALAAVLSGLMVFSWIWLVHVPRTFFSVTDGIAIFEAPAVAGIAWMIAAELFTPRAPFAGEKGSGG